MPRSSYLRAQKGLWRMRSIFLLTSFFLLIITIGFAQVEVILNDKTTGKPIEGAVVFVSVGNSEPFGQGITDDAGRSVINPANYPVRVSTSHISYISTTRDVTGPGKITISLEPSATELAEVVVTGQFEPQSAHQSVYRVRTISSERIQAVGSTRLQDVLNTELNIRFSQDLALGGSNLTMQGLSGQNVKVLIDGVPLIGRQGTGNEVNINQINVNSIERVEIVEGPMSVVYGADALAGVINIITKKPEEGKWSASVRLHEETVGKEYGFKTGIHNESVSIGYSHGKIYAMGDFARNYFGGWQGNAADRDKEWHPKTQWLGSTTVGVRKDDFDVYYRLDYLNENIYNPGLFSGIEALDQRYITNRFMHQVQGNAKLGERWRYNGALSFSDYSRKIQTTTVNRNTGDERLALGPGLQDLTTFKGLTARGTFLFKASDRLSLQSGYDINTESGSGGRLKEGVSSIEDYALFFSAELKPATWISVRPGVRFVENTAYAAPPAIPSINLKMEWGNRSELRLSYGRGFRAPSIRELFFNFFDASHSIEGNPELEAELSHSYNAAWTVRLIQKEGVQLSSTVTGFYNDVDNMIGYGVKPGNASITTYINVDKFRSKGLTWVNSLKHKNLDVTAGFGYTGRYNELAAEQEQGTGFVWAPELNSSITYSLSRLRSSVSIYYKYTGKTPFYIFDVDGTVGLNEAEAFHWADINLQKSLFKRFTVNGGIRNAFDVTRITNAAANGGPVHGGGTSQPIGYGRSYYLGITYKL